MVLFLFLAHLGVGIVFTLVFVSREAGVKFFRFNAGLAAILIAVALAFRTGGSGRSGDHSADAVIGAVRARRRRGRDRALLGDRRPHARVDPARRSWRSPCGGGVLALVLQALGLSPATARCRCRR